MRRGDEKRLQILNLCTAGFQLTSGAFFGQAESPVYPLVLSASGDITSGSNTTQDGSHNSGVGIICHGESGCKQEIKVELMTIEIPFNVLLVWSVENV